MATIGTAHTLVEWANRTQDGKVSGIANLLSQTNEAIDGMLWLPGNLPTGHKTTQVVALPAAAARAFNEGVQVTVAKTAQVEDACASIEDYSEVDKKLADLAENVSDYRLQESALHLEGMNQKFAQMLMYGDRSVNAREFTGILTRYNKIAGANNGTNIINANGAGAGCTSIVLVGWGANTCHGIFPKGSKAGLSHEDKGIVTVESAGGVAGARMEAYRDHWSWDCGISLRDWRYVVCIRNIKIADLTKNAATGADLIDLITDAVTHIPSMGMCKPELYVPQVINSFLRRQVNNKSNLSLSLDDFAGKKILSFDGIPVRRMDAISTNETAIS